jgi:hypothetical protein
MDLIRSNGGPRGPMTAQDKGNGQAALLLIECLMHALVAKGALSREEFIEIVEGAAEVEEELMAANASLPPDQSGSLLSPLANAFKTELGR